MTEAGMEKHCTHLKFTFEVAAHEFQIHSPLCISTNASTHRFLTVQLSFPLKMPQEHRPLLRLFEKASCCSIYWHLPTLRLSPLFELPGSLTTTTRMQCGHGVIVQMCYYNTQNAIKQNSYIELAVYWKALGV